VLHLITLPDGRVRLDSGSPWEPVMGYSRAVRTGPFIHVSGCVGLEHNGTFAASLSRQTERCMERIGEALGAFGWTLDSLVRLRIYTTRIQEWREIASVLGPMLDGIRPTNALLGVASLIDEAALIEIEADAWMGPGQDHRGGSWIPPH